MRTERTLEQHQVDADAARLRSLGATYKEIAQQQQCGQGEAHRRVQRALAMVPVEAVTELRQTEAEHLDHVRKLAWQIANRTHVTVSHGKIVRDETGAAVLDDGPRLQALNTLIRLSERRARMFGLDEPVTSRIEVLTEDVMDRAMRELEAEIAEREAAAALTDGD